ncbi:general odorant-binding protein 83a-like [Euwallacea similis]|uniref:general odorant-binding protein 83a-like n=1 Tax=Euwallacea similis TaxID=1736056 RepID=UPI00344F7287
MFSPVVVLFLIAAGAIAEFDRSLLSEEKRELMTTLHKTCVDQIGIPEDQIEKLKKGEFEDGNKLQKCYGKCLMAESGVMDENGGIDLEAFKELIPEQLRSKVTNTFTSCVHNAEQVNDHCDKAFKIFQCFYENDRENYFIA